MMNNLRKCLIGLVCIFGLFLCGCSTLTYVGEDYVADNIQTVKTNEEFLFNTYKKNIENANVKIGISKTPVAEVLAIYVQIENLAYETPYVFKVEDLTVSSQSGIMPFISTNNYLNIFQSQEASSMATGSALGNNLSNMAGMMNNYGSNYNQSTLQDSNRQAQASSYNHLEVLGNQILKHTVKYSSTISPRKSQYYYFFIEDKDEFPITIRYKNLKYQFNS